MDAERRVLLAEEPANIRLGDFIEEHGRVTYLFDDRHRHSSIFNPQQVIDEIRERLVQIEFDPVNDRVMIAGSQVLTALLVGVLAERELPFTLLLFNATSGKYREREVNFKVLPDQVTR